MNKLTRRQMFLASFAAPALIAAVPATKVESEPEPEQKPRIKLYTTTNCAAALAMTGAMTYDSLKPTSPAHLLGYLHGIEVHYDPTLVCEIVTEDMFVGKLVTETVETIGGRSYSETHVVPLQKALTGRWLVERYNCAKDHVLETALRMAKEHWPNDQRFHLSLMSRTL